jgi:hypothetical protein
MEGYGRIWQESGGVTAKGPHASDWRYREVPAVPIGSCCAGAGTGTPAHLLGLPPHRRVFGAAGAGRFLASSPKSAHTVF